MKWYSMKERKPELASRMNEIETYSDLILMKDKTGKEHTGFYHWTIRGYIFITTTGLSFYEDYIKEWSFTTNN